MHINKNNIHQKSELLYNIYIFSFFNEHSRIFLLNLLISNVRGNVNKAAPYQENLKPMKRKIICYPPYEKMS